MCMVFSEQSEDAMLFLCVRNLRKCVMDEENA